MRSYNAKIIPVLRNKIDRMYVTDMETAFNKSYPTDTEIRSSIKLFRETELVKHRDFIIGALSRYVVSIAKNYQEQGLPLCDLISEGITGLISAIDAFDLTNPTKFITYSNVTISRAIKEALDVDRRPVKVPKNIRNDQLKCLELVQNKLTGGEELVDIYLDIPDIYLDYIKDPKMYHKQLLIDFSGEEEEMIINSFDDTELYSVEENPLAAEDLLTDIQRVSNLLLVEKEREVIYMFFGISPYEQAYPVTNIAERLDIPADHVRRLKQQAINKLKSELSVSLLRKYL